jgi:hypothetical protein
MTDAENENEQVLILYGANKSVIAYPILPKLAEARTVQCLADAARVFEAGNPLRKELEDTPGIWRVEFV